MIDDFIILKKIEKIIKNEDYINYVLLDSMIAEEKYKNAYLKSVKLDIIERNEDFLGFQFPPLLKTIYSEFSNGLIGPGLGLKGIYPDALDTIDMDYRVAIRDGIKINEAHGDYSGFFFESWIDDFEMGLDGFEIMSRHTFFWIYGTIRVCDYDKGDAQTDFSAINCLEPNFPVYRMDYYSLFSDYAKIDKPLIPQKNLTGDRLFGGSYFECPSFNQWMDDWCTKTILKYNIR